VVPGSSQAVTVYLVKVITSPQARQRCGPTKASTRGLVTRALGDKQWDSHSKQLGAAGTARDSLSRLGDEDQRVSARSTEAARPGS